MSGLGIVRRCRETPGCGMRLVDPALYPGLCRGGQLPARRWSTTCDTKRLPTMSLSIEDRGRSGMKALRLNVSQFATEVSQSSRSDCPANLPSLSACLTIAK